MNRKEAADFLGVSTRTISNYQTLRLLNPKKVGRAMVFDLDELQELKQVKDDTTSGLVTKKDLVTIQARLSRLEANMKTLLLILDTKSGDLELSVEDAVDIYEQVKFGIASYRKLTDSSIDNWMAVLYQMDENNFSTICMINKDPKAWCLFLELANLIKKRTIEDTNYSTSVSLQCRHREASEALRRLRISGYLYLEMTGSKVREIDMLTPSLAPNNLLTTLRRSVSMKK